MARVSRCCCCDLSVGGITLGWIGVVVDFIYFITVCAFFGLYDTFGSMMSSFLGKYQSNHLMTLGWIILGIMMCLVLMMFVTDIMLIRGSIHKRARDVLPWLIIEPMCIVAYIGLCSLLDDINFILTVAAIILMRLYFWMCMISLYMELKAAAEPPAYGNVIKYLNNPQPGEILPVPTAPSYMTV